MIKLRTILPLLILTIAITGCSGLSLFPGVYRVAVDQGNIISQEIINDLKLGMTKRQALYVLGTPLILDSFDSDNWGYYYSFEIKGRVKKFKQQIQLIFEDNKLVKIEGDLQPEVLNKEPLSETYAEPAEPKKTIKLVPKDQ